MAPDAETLIHAERLALDYHDAAWQAHDGGSPPPGTAQLPDLTLEAIQRYEADDLPFDARVALDAEGRRRDRRSRDPITDSMAWVSMALPIGTGVVIAWFLLGS